MYEAGVSELAGRPMPEDRPGLADELAARRVSSFEGANGMTVVHGEFDRACGERIEKAIDAETDRLFHADGGREGAARTRTPEQRRADALAELVCDDSRGRRAKPSPPVRNQSLFTVTTTSKGDLVGLLPDGEPLATPVVERGSLRTGPVGRG